MEVVKAFNNNKLHTEIVIKGTHDNPLFRASDIGEVLEMGNIRSSISNFDDTEKGVQEMDTPGGLQNTTFLTEKGLYKLLFRSRKPIAEQFQNWICEVVKELRLKGTYSLQKQLETQKEEYDKIKETESDDIYHSDFDTNEYSDVEFKLLEERIEKLTLENELLKLKLATNQGFTPVDTNYQLIFDKLQNIEEQLQKNAPSPIDPVAAPRPQPQSPALPTYIPNQNLMTGFGQLNKTVGPRLQKINPETLTVIKVYEYLEEALKESNNVLKRPSIEKSIKEATVYHGFRWNYIAREAEDPTDVSTLPPTKEITSPATGYIAKLDEDKTKILNVYIDRKTAAQENGYIGASGLDNAVKNKKPSHGHIYMLFSECDQNLRDHFIEQSCGGNTPLLFKDGVGQYDSAGNLVCEFACKYDCIKGLKMSDKTLARALERNVEYNGHFFKKLGSKIKVLHN